MPRTPSPRRRPGKVRVFKPDLLPSDLLRSGFIPRGRVAVDTETSGLYPDLGARISVVSVAWIDDTDEPFCPNHDTPGSHQTLSSITTWGMEVIDDDLSLPVFSAAWPFDQGVEGTGKPEDRSGQISLFPSTQNLPESEYTALLMWLHLVAVEGAGFTMHHAKFDAQMFRVGVRRWPHLGWESVFRDNPHSRTHPSMMDDVKWDTQNGADLLTARNVVRMTGDGPRPTSSLKPTAAYLWGQAEADESGLVHEYLRKAKLPAGRWDLMPWESIARYADQDARLTIRLDEWQHLRIRALERALQVYRELEAVAPGPDLDEFDNVTPLPTVAAAKRRHPSSKPVQPELAGWLDGLQGRMTLREALDRRLDTSKMLYRVEARGLPFSVEASRAASAQVLERAAALERSLPFEPATLPAAKEYFFGDGPKSLNHRTYATTPTGAPVMDEMVVRKMVQDGLPHAETWRDLQKLITADSKWYTGWAERAGADGRMRTSVRQNGTVSGRFSVEGIQLQAIPHDYKLDNFEILNGIPSPRTLIGAGVPEGYKLWELDLANAELRVAALMAGCERMLELIFAGADLHADAAQALFHSTPDSPDWGELRQVAKRFNFSAIFGIGARKLAFDIEKQTGRKMSEDETRQLLKTWNGRYPEFSKAIYGTMDIVERRAKSPRFGPGVGWITLANGERRWFLPGEDIHKGFNQRVQPSLAHLANDWWLGVESHIRSEIGDAHPGVGGVGVVLMVHDSMVLLLPEDRDDLVQYGIDYGVGLWSERFPEVPGGVDAKEWANHS